MREIKPSREKQDGKCDVLVRMLTASSIEPRAEERIESRKIVILRARLPDAGRLGGAAGSSRSEAEGEIGKERKRESHEEVQRERRGRCLPQEEAFFWLLYLNERLVDTEGG
jgi:hypothetical protein